MKPPYRFFGELHRRRTGRGEEQRRHDTTNNGAVKTFVVGQICQHGISASAADTELDRAFAETFLKFIKIDIEPAAGIPDDNNRLRSDRTAPQGPKIFAIIQSWSVTDRAAVQFPSRGRGDDNENNNNSNSAPWHRRNRPLKFQRRPAVDLFGPRRFPEKQPRKAESFLKIGNK